MVNKCVFTESDSNLSFIGNWDTGPLPTERLEILRVKETGQVPKEKGDHSSDDKDGNMIITS